LKQPTQNSVTPLALHNITTSDFPRERDNCISVKLAELKPDIVDPIVVIVIQQNPRISAM
jgi:hypothetical protein